MIEAPMATPIGHALAGIAVAWGADLLPGARPRRPQPSSASWYDRAGGGLTLTCALLAAAPDLDLFVSRLHRTVTHSFLAVAVVAIVAALVATRKRLPVARVVLMCSAAWGTHLLLDWFAVDKSVPSGIQLLWPFDGRWFISGWDIFRGTERRNLFSAATMKIDAAAIAQDLAILVPILAVLWLVREKAAARLSSQLSRGNHPPQ
jgi:membrane-bound metal-dependent hydrolase YbcI (DUF457 family)